MSKWNVYNIFHLIRFDSSLQIIHAQGKFKQAKVSTIRNLVKKLKHPEKNPKQNRAAKTERYQNVLNHIKVRPHFCRFLLLLHLMNQTSKIHINFAAYIAEAIGSIGIGLLQIWQKLFSRFTIDC